MRYSPAIAQPATLEPMHLCGRKLLEAALLHHTLGEEIGTSPEQGRLPREE